MVDVKASESAMFCAPHGRELDFVLALHPYFDISEQFSDPLRGIETSEVPLLGNGGGADSCPW